MAPASYADIWLIDAKNKHVILHGKSGGYVTLSYVWGPDTKGLLTRSTFDRYALTGSLTHEDPPLTIRNTIDLIADLGERYLWVDSLCIIQDDLDDKRKYLSLMGEIYNAAMVVLVAAVETAHSGLLGRADFERRGLRPTETIQGTGFTIGGPELYDYLPTTT